MQKINNCMKQMGVPVSYMLDFSEELNSTFKVDFSLKVLKFGQKEVEMFQKRNLFT